MGHSKWEMEKQEQTTKADLQLTTNIVKLKIQAWVPVSKTTLNDFKKSILPA